MSAQAEESLSLFAPGTSPFHVKGNGYRGQIDYIQANVPGVLEQVTARDFVDYLRQPFLAGTWYDLFPFVALQRAAGLALGISALEFTARFSRSQAQRDISGVYRWLLKLTSPERVMSRLPRVAGQYYDFLEIQNTEVGDRAYESRITGTPAVAAGMYRVSTGAFIQEALTTAGAKGVDVRWVGVAPEPDRHGVKIVTLTRRVSWLA
jgi:hypothetical protein